MMHTGTNAKAAAHQAVDQADNVATYKGGNAGEKVVDLQQTRPTGAMEPAAYDESRGANATHAGAAGLGIGVEGGAGPTNVHRNFNQNVKADLVHTETTRTEPVRTENVRTGNVQEYVKEQRAEPVAAAPVRTHTHTECHEVTPGRGLDNLAAGVQAHQGLGLRVEGAVGTTEVQRTFVQPVEAELVHAEHTNIAPVRTENVEAAPVRERVCTERTEAVAEPVREHVRSGAYEKTHTGAGVTEAVSTVRSEPVRTSDAVGYGSTGTEAVNDAAVPGPGYVAGNEGATTTHKPSVMDKIKNVLH